MDSTLQQDFQLCLPMKPTSPREIHREIMNLNMRKAPGFDLILVHAEILRMLTKKAVVFLIYTINGVLRLGYFPRIWKVSQIMMIHKPGKPPNEVTSYRPRSLLPIMSKICEKIILRRLEKVMNIGVIPNHQFGFRKKYSTLEQVHRVCDTVRQTLERKEYCSGAFLDIQQAFDRVWHKGLLCKVKTLLPHSFFPLLKSYLSEKKFQVKMKNSCSTLYECRAGILQGSVLGSVLYCIYTADLPVTPGVVTATYADETALLSTSKDRTTASTNLQVQLNKTEA